MKKLLLLLLALIIVSVGCQHKPPIPDPVNLCGNGVIDPGETHENCPSDVPAPPPQKCGNGVKDPGETHENCPEDVPPPVRKCGDEPLDPDCPEIKRDFSQHILLGNYTGPTGQDDFDWEGFFKLFPNKKGLPNGNSIHALSPWDNPDSFFPWVKVGNKFDLTKWNEKWWAHLREGLLAAEYYDVETEFCLIDQYGTAEPNGGWAKYPTISKIHPFRNNVQGSNVTDGDRLYSNWNRQDHTNPRNYALFMWKGDDEYNLRYYRATSASGQAFMNYVTRFAEECYAVWKKGKLRLLIRPANEPRAVVLADGRTFDHARGNEIDGRTEMFVVKTFEKAGFKKGERFHIVFESITTTYSDLRPALYWPEKTMRTYIKPKGGLGEWHGIDTVDQLKAFFPTLDPELLIGSSDGSPENVTPLRQRDGTILKPYKERMQGIYKSKPRWFDYKMFASKSGYKWDWRNLNKNVKVVVPWMLENIFRGGSNN